MKAKKIRAKNIKSAMDAAIKNLGPDAIIIQKNVVPTGIEVIAAREGDYEEAKAEQKRRGHTNRSPDIVEYKMEQSDQPKAKMWVDYEIKNRKVGPVTDSMSEKSRHERESVRENKSSSEDLELNKLNEERVAMREMSSDIKNLKDLLELQTEPLKELKYIRDSFSAVNLRSKALSPASAVYDMLYSRMSRMGLNDRIKVRMSAGIEASVTVNKAWTMALSNLSNIMVTGEKNPISKGGVFAFLGATGVGKTTTIGKIATQHVMDHGNESIVLVTTDAFKIASFEQLKTFGRILDVPVYAISERDSLAAIIASIDPNKTILIDTAGMSIKGDIAAMQSKMIADVGVDIQRYLVLSASSQETFIEKVWESHAKFGINGLIVSKVDESSSLGPVIATSIEKNVPILYLADGQKIPDDCHVLDNREIIILGLQVAQLETQRLIDQNVRSKTA
jgi:flagellar biosynthesis protein FlhF